MRKIFTLILLLSGILKTASAQTPTWLWAISAAGGNNYQYGDGAAIDDSGFYYMGGRFAPAITFGSHSLNTAAPATQFFGKFDESGNCLWLAQQFYSYGYDYPRGFCIDRAKNNNVYATGLVSSGSSMYVVKFNNNGVFQWSTTLGAGSGYTTCPNADGIAADTAGNVYVTGQTGGGSGTNWTFGDSVLNYSGTSSSQEMFLTKLDKNGNLLWAIGADGSTAANDGYDVGRSVTLDKTGQYVFVAGGYYGTPSFHSRNPSGDIVPPAQSGANSTLFIAKYDTGGNLIFVTTAPGAGIPWTGSTFTSSVGASNSIATDSCDDIFVTGNYSGSSTFGPFTLTAVGSNDGFVACCNSKGQWQWADDIGGTGTAGGSSIALDKDNDVYVGGGLSGTANFGYGISATATASGDAFIAKYANSTGAVQWVLTPTGSGASGGGSVAVDNQKFVYFTGSFSGTMSLGTNSITYNGSYGQGIYIAKLDTVPARYIIPVVDSSYCPGSTVNLPYSIIGTFNTGNSFIAQLSDSTGSFVNAQNIGADTSTSGGTIPVTIPPGTPPGSTYLIRVISTNPATSSYVNGCGAYYQKNVYINNFYVNIGGNIGIKASNDTSICSGTSVQLNISGGSTWSWSPGKSLSDSTIANPIATPVTPQTYTVVVHSGVCVARDSIKVGVNPSATISATPRDTTICTGSTVTLNSSGASTYSWSPASSLTSATISNPVASPTVNTTYTVSGSTACTLPDTVVVNVGNTSMGGKIIPLRDTICSGTKGNLTLTNYSGSPIQWQSSLTNSNFTPLTSPGDSTYQTDPLLQSTYYRAVVGSGSCVGISDSLLLVIPPQLTADFGFTKSGTTVTFLDSSTGSIVTYAWTFGDGGTSILKNPVHTYANNDSAFNVCLTIYDGSNCSYTFCKDVLATGIPQIAAQTNWNVYPDPFSSQLLISGKELNAKIKSIEMYDVLGRTVLNETPGNLNSSVITLNVSNLAEGMYYLKIKTALATGEADYIQKVIKQGN